jgi:branched-chain amino acid transport system substrate-binding protein
MKKFLLTIIIAVTFTKNLFAELPTEIRIGLVSSQSGPAGEQGKAWEEGAVLAAEQMQSELSRKSITLHLTVEDDTSIPAKSVTAFKKLATVDHVQGVVGGTWDYLAESIFPLAKAFKIPLVSPSNPPEIFSAPHANNPFIFSNGLSLAAEEIAITGFLKKKDVKTISIVTVDVPFGTSHAELVKKVSKSLGIQVIEELSLPVEGFMNVLKLAANKARAAHPQLIYLVSDAAGVDLFTRELAALNISIPVLSTQHVYDGFLLSKDLKRFSKVYGVYPKYESKEFDAAFRKRFDKDPKVFASNGYDAVRFLVNAILAGTDFSKSDATFSYKGITGEHALPAKAHKLVKDEAEIMGFESGEWGEVR